MKVSLSRFSELLFPPELQKSQMTFSTLDAGDSVGMAHKVGSNIDNYLQRQDDYRMQYPSQEQLDSKHHLD